jgi:O-antigen ligase
MLQEARMRAHAFVHAVTYGEQMALAALGSLAFLGRAEVGESGPRSRLCALAFLVLSAAALLFSQTRGALLGLVAGIFVLGLAYRPYRRYAAGALAAALLAAALMETGPNRSRSLYHSLRIEGITAGDNDLNPNLHRLILWRVALQMFRDHPWLGIGLGNYKTAFVNYFQGKVDGQWVWHSAHNLYLQTLAERGGAGLAALVLLLGALAWRSYERVRQDPSPWNLWALSSMGAFLAMNLTEVALQVEMVATLVFFIWAWAEANHGVRRRT